ncbi:hypothetical protein [Amycolatopsis thermophila]|uniref:Uncharacterized protein n=1 Tax=Amycolatopsis thermophila TaxID=206084 RepID=A0ABU0EMX7_9PSEU|nr:hypothetical protein [Amycolatopsis thermophila]MDQ0376633.1 hypothetical protein [Amycolatopsis thermophila]
MRNTTDIKPVAIAKPSDQHGEPCEYCQALGQVCVTNIYVTDEDGDRDTRHTCEREACIAEALADHTGDDDPYIEVSTYVEPIQLGAAA